MNKILILDLLIQDKVYICAPNINVEEHVVNSAEKALVYIKNGIYELLIIYDNGETEYVCSFLQELRKYSFVPVLVLVEGELDVHKLYVQNGADIVLQSRQAWKQAGVYVYSLLRRWNKWGRQQESFYKVGNLFINTKIMKAYWKTQEINLTRKEIVFLKTLAVDPGKVCSYEHLYEKVWKERPFENTKNILWCFVKRLKKKLYVVDPAAPDIIYNIRAIGYSLKDRTIADTV